MSIEIDKLYEDCFSGQTTSYSRFHAFSDYQPICEGGEFAECRDFSVSSHNALESWQQTATKIAIFALKIVIIPWGFYEVFKGVVRYAGMNRVYPAQYKYSQSEYLNLRKSVQKKFLDEKKNGLIGREIVLQKDGRSYNGLLIGNKENILNGKWVLFAPGNSCLVEDAALLDVDKPFAKLGYNVLMVNGPGVGKSSGPATAKTLGEAQELGLTFLETALKAKKIIIAGHSLGGAAIGQAILQHTFKPDVDYLAVRIMTFSRLSDIVRKRSGSIAAWLVSWINEEMDSVAASKKLQDQKVHEIVIQGGEDHVMMGVELLNSLEEQGLMDNKSRLVIPWANHFQIPVTDIAVKIRKWDPPSPSVSMAVAAKGIETDSLQRFWSSAFGSFKLNRIFR